MRGRQRRDDNPLALFATAVLLTTIGGMALWDGLGWLLAHWR